MTSSDEPTRGALQGVTVLEAAGYITGPYASMLLADLGADVIKIEGEAPGDPYRSWDGGNYSTNFRSFNRNKRSITLNLRSQPGRDIFLRLASQADVIIENYRPGVVQRLGIDYPTVRALNPRVVYCSISGFGQEGPYKDWPGYDTVGQAMGGLLSLITDLDRPDPAGIAFSDHLTGIFAAYGILGALYARQQTGQGQKVETSLLQSTASFVQESAARFLDTGIVTGREIRVQGALIFAFVAGDSLPFALHLSSPPKFWEGLTEAIEQPGLREDPRFRSRADRIRNYPALKQLLGETFATQPRAAWLDRLRSQDVPCAPINTIQEVLDDPQVRRHGMPISLHHPTMGDIRLSGNPITFGDTPVRHRLAPPLLGEHTAEVLRELGYDGDAIQQLRHQGVI